MPSPAPRTRCIDGSRAHHWLFEETNGPMASGECLRCGASLVARNGFVAHDDNGSWNGNRHAYIYGREPLGRLDGSRLA
jgi:hypothetical protein